ncbi:hypothetical protein BJX99DRAFT_256659 [Aspergillus californicus]
MADRLPLEILMIIAGYLGSCPKSSEYPVHPANSLVRYALVCRKWQAAFEPIIWTDVVLRASVSEVVSKGPFLPYFRELTTGPRGEALRSMIRTLHFAVKVLCEDSDDSWDVTSKKSSLDGSPGLYWQAVMRLFKILQTWDGSRGLNLCIDAPGLPYYGDSEHNPHRGITWPHYPGDAGDQSTLPAVECVKRLSFQPCGEDEMLISREMAVPAKMLLHIAQLCPNLTGLHMFLCEHGTRATPAFVQEHRLDIAGKLPTLSPSLRSLYLWDCPNDDPLPDVPVGGGDLLSSALRATSEFLRELRLEDIALPPDLLWPLDTNAQPTGTPMHWPHLQSIEFRNGPYPAWNEWTEFGGYDDDYDTYYHPQSSHSLDRSMRLHYTFISLGFAAQHMPRLTRIEYVDQNGRQWGTRFDFRLEESSGEATLNWNSEASSSYIPDERVAEAWGWKDMEVICPALVRTTFTRVVAKIPSWALRQT